MARRATARFERAVDTNVLVRAADPVDPAHRTAIEGLIRLRHAGTALWVAAQNVIEFWSVVTRPVSSNGLGWPIDAAMAERRRIERLYRLVPDEPGIYERWRGLVDEYRVGGRQVFAARLVAIMLIAEIDGIVTFNRAISPATGWRSSTRLLREVILGLSVRLNHWGGFGGAASSSGNGINSSWSRSGSLMRWARQSAFACSSRSFEDETKFQ
jgi:predicted nucleic acid-binding protein